MMLRHLGEIDLAGRIEQACYDVIASKQHVTFDLGGTATTSEFTQAICSQVMMHTILSETEEIRND